MQPHPLLATSHVVAFLIPTRNLTGKSDEQGVMNRAIRSRFGIDRELKRHGMLVELCMNIKPLTDPPPGQVACATRYLLTAPR